MKLIQNSFNSSFFKDGNFLPEIFQFWGGIRSRVFFCETKMVSKWFQIFLFETTLDFGWFQVTLEVFFFLEKVSIPKNDLILAKIHHMLGFT